LTKLHQNDQHEGKAQKGLDNKTQEMPEKREDEEARARQPVSDERMEMLVEVKKKKKKKKEKKKKKKEVEEEKEKEKEEEEDKEEDEEEEEEEERERALQTAASTRHRETHGDEAGIGARLDDELRATGQVAAVHPEVPVPHQAAQR
jgi:outer membrane biosynthesis protein TonB